MIRKTFITALLSLFAVASVAQSQPKWKLVWEEDFNSKKLDTTVWSVIPRGAPDWKRFMSPQKDLITLEGGNLVLTGRVNTDASDTSRYVTGGVYSKDKYAFMHGRIEIRAKLGCAQGAWPAIWLLPNNKDRVWPDDGEIDIMEHLNFDDFIYQTAHSKYTQTLGITNNPRSGGRGKIHRDQYNVYALEWYADRLVWLINGETTFIYPRIETDKDGQWPFTQPFYILLDQQLGGPGTWVGAIDQAQLPVKMWIDWVRIYKQ